MVNGKCCPLLVAPWRVALHVQRFESASGRGCLSAGFYISCVSDETRE